MEIRHNKLDQQIGQALVNWKGCEQPPKTEMHGEYCSVVPLDIDKHAEQLYDAFATDKNKGNWTYLMKGPFKDFDAFFSWMKATCSGNDPLFHAVINPKTQRAVGIASYMRIDPTMGVIEVGNIHFSPLMQKTPMSTEAMYLMMRRVFDELGYRRYEWKCDSLNSPSKNAARRLGFSYEGTFRQLLVYKNRNRDTSWFSLLDHEWPAQKTVFEAWLKPDNFDQNGVQRKKLKEC